MTLPAPARISGSEPAVALRGAVCVRDGHPVLRGAQLAVPKGQTLLITGANGAGKSTLLRVLAGLLPLAAGHGTVLGHDLSRDRARIRRRVALVAHDDFCYADLTVAQNLRFQAQANGKPARAADEWIDRLDLAVLADRRVGALSAGQRKRCALAMAFIRDSELLMLDEPHAALDAASRDAVDGILAAAARRGGTMIIVSHDRQRVRGFADRELTVSNGAVGVSDTTTQGLAAPDYD